MKRLIILFGFAGLLTAGCSSGGDSLTMTASERATAEAAQSAMRATSTTIETTTTTTPAPAIVTPVTVATTAPCVPVDTTAQQRYVDSTETSIRQLEGAIAGIQLVIDNGTRDRDRALRHQATIQTDYNNAVKVFNLVGSDSARDKVTYQEGRLADAKDLVADWDSLLTKARGDLTRARAQKADYEKKARDMRAQIVAAASCSLAS